LGMAVRVVADRIAVTEFGANADEPVGRRMP
jgi:hypothetical protein